MPNDPDWKLKAWSDREEIWRTCRDLISGTKAMQEGGEKYSRRQEREGIPEYQRRIARSRLYPGFANAIEGVSGRPFERAVRIEGIDDKEELIKALVKDPARDGQSLTSFAKQCFTAGARDGVFHIHVEYPSLSPDATLEEARAINARPYFCLIPADRLIRWEVDRNGRLTMAAIYDSYTEVRSDEEVLIETVRVLYPGRQVLFTKVNTGDKAAWDTGVETVVSIADEIPLVTVYFNKCGAMIADPPFEKIARANVTHWDLESDYRNALRFGMIGVLCATGFDEDEAKVLEKQGPTALYVSTNADAKVYFVEHTGSALALATGELKKLEMEMQAEAGKPYVEKIGDETATGRKIDDKRNGSLIMTWITRTEEGLDKAFYYAAKYEKKTLPDDFSVELWDDFVTLANSGSADQILAVRKNGDLTRRTYLLEMKRRGVLAEDVDVDAEIAEIEDAEKKAAEEEMRMAAEMAKMTSSDSFPA